MAQATPDSRLDVVNVVSQRPIGCEIELDQLGMDLEGARYNPSDFPGVVYQKDGIKATVLIFRSGEMICTGAESISTSREIIDDVIEELNELGVRVDDDIETSIQNIVYSGTLHDDNINLNAIAIGLGLENVEYEPEQFPGLIYRPDEGSQTVLLFGSGKMVLAGMKVDDDPAEMYEKVSSKMQDLGLM